MKKTAMKVMALSMASLMAMGMSAFAAETEKESTYDFAGGTVYGIYKAGDQTWFIDEGAAAQAAVEALGGEFIYVDAKMSPEEYLKDIDNAVANNASGIVTCIPDQTLSQAAVDAATAAGIPIVAADDALRRLAAVAEVDEQHCRSHHDAALEASSGAGRSEEDDHEAEHEGEREHEVRTALYYDVLLCDTVFESHSFSASFPFFTAPWSITKAPAIAARSMNDSPMVSKPL